MVATPTASGKTLCYSLPILEKCLQDPDSRALMLFPLKALAQDQLAAFGELTGHWPEAARPSIAIYDGDTTDHFRRKIRKNPPNVLITNPEMLHLAILPFHEQWTTFLASLSLVVVDEAHTYRGVLGSHTPILFSARRRSATRRNWRAICWAGNWCRKRGFPRRMLSLFPLCFPLPPLLSQLRWGRKRPSMPPKSRRASLSSANRAHRRASGHRASEGGSGAGAADHCVLPFKAHDGTHRAVGR